jgi:DNA-binding transcriptional ArsR family regulator
MTDKHLDAVMSALPDDLDEGELCALTLTIYRAFVGDHASIISELVTAIYCVGEISGMSRSNISRALREMTALWDLRQNDQAKH